MVPPCHLSHSSIQKFSESLHGCIGIPELNKAVVFKGLTKGLIDLLDSILQCDALLALPIYLLKFKNLPFRGSLSSGNPFTEMAHLSVFCWSLLHFNSESVLHNIAVPCSTLPQHCWSLLPFNSESVLHNIAGPCSTLIARAFAATELPTIDR